VTWVGGVGWRLERKKKKEEGKPKRWRVETRSVVEHCALMNGSLENFILLCTIENIRLRDSVC